MFPWWDILKEKPKPYSRLAMVTMRGQINPPIRVSKVVKKKIKLCSKGRLGNCYGVLKEYLIRHVLGDKMKDLQICIFLVEIMSVRKCERNCKQWLKWGELKHGVTTTRMEQLCTKRVIREEKNVWWLHKDRKRW